MKLINGSTLEENLIFWAKKFLIYKLQGFDTEKASASFDIQEFEEKYNSCSSFNELHDVSKEIARNGLKQVSKNSLGVLNFYEYLKKENFKSMKEIDNNSVKDFINIECKDRKLSEGTRKNYRDAVIDYLTFISNSNTDKFKYSINKEEIGLTGRVKREVMDFLTKKDYQILNKALPQYKYKNEFEKSRNILIMRLFLFSGLTLNELRTLKEDNFIFDNNEIILHLRRELPKTDRKNREIALKRSSFIKYFNKYQELREKNKDEYFFYSPIDKNKQIDGNLVNSIIKELLTFAGINNRDMNCTMLRRSFALYLHNNKVHGEFTMPFVNIMSIMGIESKADLERMLMYGTIDQITATKIAFEDIED